MGTSLAATMQTCHEEECCKATKLRHVTAKPKADGEVSDRATERLVERLFDLYDADGKGSVERELLRDVVDRISNASHSRRCFLAAGLESPEEKGVQPNSDELKWCVPDLVDIALESLRGAFAVGTAESGERVARDEFRQLVQCALQRNSGGSPSSVLQQVVTECYDETRDSLIETLFRVQDLNSDGLLEESELVQLNKKIAMLHYGKDVNKDEVSAKFRTIFRNKLDADGSPVTFGRFKEHVLAELEAMDAGDPAAHCTIVEQWVAEATAARDMFRVPSMQSINDLPFLLAAPLQLADSEEAFDDTVSKVTTPPVAMLPRQAPRTPVPSVISGSTVASAFSSESPSFRRHPSEVPATGAASGHAPC